MVCALVADTVTRSVLAFQCTSKQSVDREAQDLGSSILAAEVGNRLVLNSLARGHSEKPQWNSARGKASEERDPLREGGTVAGARGL